MALFACLSLRPGRKDPGLGDKPLGPNLHFDAFDPWVFGASSGASSCAWPACFFSTADWSLQNQDKVSSAGRQAGHC